MSVKANKKSLKQQGGSMIPEAPGMMDMPQQQQQPQVDPQVIQIVEVIKTSVSEGKELVQVIKELMSQEVDQQLIGQALMMGGLEEEDIITIFETVATPPEPSSPEEVDRDPQLLARNRDIAKREREAASQAESQEQEVDVSDQVRMAKSGIEIKPENKGKFTAWAKKRGMGVQEAARKVMANKGKYPPSIVKMANFARNAAKFKKDEGGDVPSDYTEGVRQREGSYNPPNRKYTLDSRFNAKTGTEVDTPGQYINGVFIPDESEIDKSNLSNNLSRPANFYMSDNHYAVAPLAPPPQSNVLFDFISTATGINQELGSREKDAYGNQKGALRDLDKKMEMHEMTKPLYYDIDVDTSNITTPENMQAYVDWALQQKKEWDGNTQRQLDEQGRIIEETTGKSSEDDTRTFTEWAEEAGHDIVKMSENAVNLLQNLWKRTTGKMKKGGGTNNEGFKALPSFVQGKILSGMKEGGENDYLANRDKVIKRAIARQEGKYQYRGEVNFPAENPDVYNQFPFVTEDYSDEEELLNEDQVFDMDGDGRPDTIDVDGGDGTGEARLGTIDNPSANQLFDKVDLEPEINVTNAISGTVDRINDNPYFRAFTSLSDSAVKGSRFANDIYDDIAYRDSLDKFEERSGADYKFAVKTSDPMSEGFYDANSGQLQGEAERTAGYYGSFAGSPYSFQGTAKEGTELDSYQDEGETKKERKNRVNNYNHPYLEEYIKEFKNSNLSNEFSAKDILSQMNVTANDTLFMGSGPTYSSAKTWPNMDVTRYIASQIDKDAFDAGENVRVGYEDRMPFNTTEPDPEDGKSYGMASKTVGNDIGDYLHLIKTKLFGEDEPRQKHGGEKEYKDAFNNAGGDFNKKETKHIIQNMIDMYNFDSQNDTIISSGAPNPARGNTRKRALSNKMYDAGYDGNVDYNNIFEIIPNNPFTMDQVSFMSIPKNKEGGEIVELSQDMIAQLIAAGADIEII